MSNTQARLIALSLVMIAGSLYSVVLEEVAPLLLGGFVFIAAGIFFAIEYKKSFKDKTD